VSVARHLLRGEASNREQLLALFAVRTGVESKLARRGAFDIAMVESLTRERS